MIEKKGSCKEVNMKSAKNQHSSSRSIYIYMYIYVFCGGQCGCNARQKRDKFRVIYRNKLIDIRIKYIDWHV